MNWCEEMETDENKLKAIRRKKRQELFDLGINPYPHVFKPTHHSSDIHGGYDGLENGEESDDEVIIGGRVTRLSEFKKMYFGDIQDEKGKVQIMIPKKGLTQTEQDILARLDIGDIIGVKGNVLRSRRGELTVRTQTLDLLTKTLMPLPDKWGGLTDPDTRYRNRSLDMVVHPELKEVFRKRSRAISAMREFLDQQGYLEVEIPTLQPVYGGASARPFETYVNALGQTFFLSISPELYLKRIIAGGFEGVYTICKNFRNEGIDKTHNPEFTMMECYVAWADYHDMMRLTEQVYAHIFGKILGTTVVDYQGTELDFTPQWPRVRMLDLVREHSGVDVGDLTEERLRAVLRESKLDPGFYKHGIPIDKVDEWTWGEIVQEMFEYFAEPTLVQPTFVIDHPKESTPLCKIHRKDERLIERFEPFAYGVELANAYSELNDPVLQRQLLEDQSRSGRGEDEEKYQMDHEFCDAVDLGLPPMGGLGIGIDRMVMFMTDATTIKDVIFFPMMRYVPQ